MNALPSVSVVKRDVNRLVSTLKYNADACQKELRGICQKEAREHIETK